MFLLPVGDSCVAEGRNDEDPIHLIGIQKDEFEQLLSVLFHRQVHRDDDARLSGISDRHH